MILNCRHGAVRGLGAAALVLVGQLAQAAHPLSTEDVGTQGPGAVELSTAVDAVRTTAHHPLELAAGVGLALGIGERVDVGLGLGYAAITDLRSGLRGGMDSPELSLKWRLREVGTLPGFAVRLAYTPFQDWAAQLVGSHEIGSWELNANLGASQVLPSLSREDWVTSASFSVSAPLHPRLRVGAEVLGEWTPANSLRDGALVSSLLAAAQWEALPNGVLSAGVGPSFVPGSLPSWLCTAGFTFVVD